MNAKPPETFSLDRLQTPIGVALLVTDADGALRALDWEDFEPRMKDLLRLHYGAVVLEEARAPSGLRGMPGTSASITARCSLLILGPRSISRTSGSSIWRCCVIARSLVLWERTLPPFTTMCSRS